MTTIYERGAIREAAVWSPFGYAMKFTDAVADDRAVFYGLFAYCYLQGSEYLQDISAFELALIVDQYDSNMAALDNERQVLVLEIASKRYIHNLKMILKDQEIATKRAKITQERTEYDIRLAALVADREAITTQQKRLQIETEKAASQVKVLQARIATEQADQENVDIQITEAQLKKEQVILQQLETANRALEIQLRIVETAIESSEIDVDLSRSAVKLVQIENDIQEAELSAKDLEVLDAQIENETYKVDTIGPLREEVRALDLEDVEAQIEDVGEITTSEAGVYAARSSLDTAKTNQDEVQLQNRVEMSNAEAGLVEGTSQRLTLADKAISEARIGHSNTEYAIKTQSQTVLNTAKTASMQTEYAAKTVQSTVMATARNKASDDETDARLSVMGTENAARLAAQEGVYDARLQAQESEAKAREVSAEQEADARADVERDQGSFLTGVKLSSEKQVMDAQYHGAVQHYLGAVNAAEAMAGANVVSNLEHRISGG